MTRKGLLATSYLVFSCRGFYIYYMRKTVFADNHGNELKFHINDKNELYIYVGQPENVFMGNGYICLNKEDLCDLIEELKQKYASMLM